MALLLRVVPIISALCYTLCAIPCARRSCVVRVNEVKGVEYGSIDFVELKGIFLLKEITAAGMSLAGMKMVFLKNKNEIVAIVTLQNSKLGSKGLFTVGGAEINPSMPWNSPNAKIKGLSSSSSQTRINAFFKTQTTIVRTGQDSKGIYAIMLLGPQPSDELIQVSKLTNIAFSGSVPPTLDAKLEKIMRDNLLDVVILNTEKEMDKSPLFDRLVEHFRDREKYILHRYRWSSPDQGGEQYSLSRCTCSADAFIPDSFRLTTPTPNGDNECDIARNVLNEDIEELQETDGEAESTTPEVTPTGEVPKVDIGVNTEISQHVDCRSPRFLTLVEMGANQDRNMINTGDAGKIEK